MSLYPRVPNRRGSLLDPLDSGGFSTPEPLSLSALTAPVGPGGANRSADVGRVEHLLSRSGDLAPKARAARGLFDPPVEAGVRAFQVRRGLKPDGLLLVNLLGGTTLGELRAALLEAETDIYGGAGPRTVPMADIRDVGGLLGRAGLALPVADSDRLTIDYPDMFRLMADLRGMGEANAMRGRRKAPTTRRLFLRAAEIYQDRFGRADGRIPASFEIITLTGWAPHDSQQQPQRPGSAAHRLASSLGVDEQDPETGKTTSTGPAAPE